MKSHFGDMENMAANMDNDTRGWVMCVTSGVGKYCTLPWEHTLCSVSVLIIANSMRAWSKYHLCRCSSTLHTKSKEFQDTG